MFHAAILGCATKSFRFIIVAAFRSDTQCFGLLYHSCTGSNEGRRFGTDDARPKVPRIRSTLGCAFWTATPLLARS